MGFILDPEVAKRVALTQYAIDKKRARTSPVLGYVLLDSDGADLIALATDRYSIVRVDVPLDDDGVHGSLGHPVLVSLDLVKLIGRANIPVVFNLTQDGSPDTVSIEANSQYQLPEFLNGWHFRDRSEQLNYPPLERLFPETVTSRFDADPTNFAASLAFSAGILKVLSNVANHCAKTDDLPFAMLFNSDGGNRRPVLFSKPLGIRATSRLDVLVQPSVVFGTSLNHYRNAGIA